MNARTRWAGTVVAVLLAAQLAAAPVHADGPGGAGVRSAVQTRPEPACVARTGPMTPRSVELGRIARTVEVVRVRRTKDGSVGTPPVTDRGKWLLGRDPQARPGDGQGTVITVAHTWPDGSALGNALLRSLRRGGQITFAGRGGDEVACYRVTQRRSYRAERLPRRKAFRDWGPEQLVIVVCSGKRLGPGRWTHRTVWYATPVPRR